MDKKKFTYYPGCSVKGTNRAYDMSTRSVAGALGIELSELDDWNCCGATAYMAIHEKRAFVLSARNLAIAEKEGLELVTVCNGCYLVLNKTNKYMSENPQLQAEIQKALAAGGMNYRGGVKVRHFLDVIVNDLGEEEVRGCVSRPLSGLKVAPYYGCQISRPFGEIDDPEDPQMMDRLIEWLGGEPVPFALKAKCCGGMMMTTQPEIGVKLSGNILKCARDQGADCIITACPLCQINLEAYQDTINDAMGQDCSIPILYFTQLMGAAFGINQKDLALKDSLTPVEELLTEKVYNS
ncbi:MAG: CoB--CoM heterodisulfide reductase iron-sulfur subunit B family protein [Sedimentisphaerales bacterium]|nr:CoB--CoM heterodisulfide reductase iron-sulfur subunit B family protein [Sedimentisphaerales bacterium]